jgi:hypothetical protein
MPRIIENVDEEDESEIEEYDDDAAAEGRGYFDGTQEEHFQCDENQLLDESQVSSRSFE